jgi:hypothetical protein
VRASSYKVTRQLVVMGSRTAGESFEGQPMAAADYWAKPSPIGCQSAAGRRWRYTSRAT